MTLLLTVAYVTLFHHRRTKESQQKRMFFCGETGLHNTTLDLFVYKTSNIFPMQCKLRQVRQKAWDYGVAPSVQVPNSLNGSKMWKENMQRNEQKQNKGNGYTITSKKQESKTRK